MQTPVLTRLVALVGVVMLAIMMMLMPNAPLASAQQAGPLALTQSVQPGTPIPTTAVPSTPVPTTQVPVSPIPTTAGPTQVPTDVGTQVPTDVATQIPSEVPTSTPGDRTGNVAVTKSADPTQARVGDTVTFSILVTNPSRYDTPRVVLSDDLPGYFELLSVRSARGTPVVNGNTITIDLDTVVSGEEIAVTVQVRVLKGAPAVMVNVATLTSPNGSDSVSDNIARAEVRRIDDSASAPRPVETGTATSVSTGVAVGGTPTVTPANGGAAVQPTPRRPGRLPRTGGDEDPIGLVLLLIGAGMAVAAGGMLLRRRA